MALDKPGLVNAIIALKDLPPTDPYNPRPAAQALADAIEAYVKSGDVAGVTVHRDHVEYLDSSQTGFGRIQ